MDLVTLIGRARERDLEAFAEITRRFQHMAYGYALSILRDLGQAEDVVQEAFVAAWFGLARLEDSAAFPGWIRGIVRHQAHRVLRRKRVEEAPLAEARGLVAEIAEPEGHIERRRRAGTVLAAITELPAPLREVVTLFYVHECSQQDIATFLGLPVTTVNNRLHAGRARLKRRVIAMMKDTLASNALPDDFAARIGRIVRTREGVIEARFDPEALPGVLTELTVSDEARQRAITAQVVQRRADGLVRAVSTGFDDALSPGMAVLSERRYAPTPYRREGFERTVQVLSGERTGAPRLLETGIKVIDVMCPLAAGGTMAVAGEYRAGTVVLVEELVRRLCSGADRLSVFAVAPLPMTTSFEEMWKKEGYSDGTVGAVETFYFPGEEGTWTAERLSTLTGVDAVIRLSEALGKIGIYPTVDPLTSRSRLLETAAVSPEQRDVASRGRQALALAAAAPASAPSPEQELAWRRARKLQRFFAQPFFVAEPYTKRPGLYVPMNAALAGCRAILDGECDDVPEEAFYFTGTLDDVLRAAAARRAAGGAATPGGTAAP